MTRQDPAPSDRPTDDRPTDDDRPTIVVLGASGFLGSAVTRTLAQRPVRLRAVGRHAEPRQPVPAVAQFEARTADLLTPGALAGLVADADVVVHLVAHTDGGWRSAEDANAAANAERTNVGLAEDLVNALAARREGPPPLVLFAGSTSQSGATHGRPIDGTERDRPLSAYCEQKLRAELVLKRATADGLIRAISLRLPTVYGLAPRPGNERGVVAAMTSRALTGLPLTLWNDGTVHRDLLHVTDAASAFAAALDHPEALVGGHWPVGTGEGMPLAGLFQLIARSVAEHTGETPVPVHTQPPPHGAVDADQESVRVDSTAFRQHTGWQHQVRPHPGVQRTVSALAARDAHTSSLP